MRLPELIPIRHEPDYRTDRIGRHAGGQFFADVTAAYREGHHTGSKVSFAGVRAESPAAVERAERTLSGWLADLGPITYGDIAIRPFRADVDDVVFGLIDETTDDPYTGHGGPWAELYPQRLGFHEPWNGEYDT